MSVAWNAVNGLRDIYRSVAGRGKIAKCSNQTGGAGDLRHPNTLLTETLEPRLLLSASTDAETAIELFNASPAVFIENQGQWEDDSVYFLHKGDGANVAHTGSGPVFELFREAAIAGPDLAADLLPDAIVGDTAQAAMESFLFSLEFEGNNSVIPVGLDESDSLFNFCIGDQSNWREGVTGYETVAYEGLYDGIDLYTWGQRDSLKYEFHVSPGADYEQIVLSYSGVEDLSLTEDGSLIVNLGGDWGVMTDDAPYIYQIIDGEEVAVEGRFVLLDGLDGNAYSFEITGNYDKNHELIIDPDVAWSTYLGGSGSDVSFGVAVDSSGSVLVTGATLSSGWVSGGWDINYNGGSYGDVFLVKLSSSGSHLWSTYLGGSDTDQGIDIAVDSSGNVLVTGYTGSSGWVSGGWDTSYNGSTDGFVLKLSSSGSHLWSTYLGGSGWDYGRDIAVDSSGNVLVTGNTYSSGWISDGWDTSHNGSADGFVLKLSSSGSHIWSTYLGGSSYDHGYGLAVDSSGNVLVTGTTSSSGWISDGWDTSFNGYKDAFIVKLSSSGDHLWSTYLGGSGEDSGSDIAVDASGNALVTGRISSSGWVSGGWDTSYNGSYDAFVLKLSSSGSHIWSTCLGGSDDDRGFGIAVDSSGNALVTGWTYSSGWVSGGWDTSLNGGRDGFVVKFSSSGSHLWSTYLGGSGFDWGYGIAVDSSGNAFVTGETSSSGWVSGGYDTSYNGDSDAFVVKINNQSTDSIDLDISNLTDIEGDYQPGETLAGTVTIQNLGTQDLVDSFWFKAVLSLDTVWGNDDDIIVYLDQETLDIDAGVSYDSSDSGLIPLATPAGSYYLAMMIDSEDDIAESDESNNIVWSDNACVNITGGTSANSAVALDWSHIASDTLSVPGQVSGGQSQRWYKFDALVGKRYVFEAYATAYLDPVLKLYDASDFNTPLVISDNATWLELGVASATAPSIALVPDQAKTYYVAVSAKVSIGGQFNLYAKAENYDPLVDDYPLGGSGIVPPSDAPELGFYKDVAGRLEYSGDVDWFSINPFIGGSLLRLNVQTSGNMPVKVSLVDSAGNLVNLPSDNPMVAVDGDLHYMGPIPGSLGEIFIRVEYDSPASVNTTTAYRLTFHDGTGTSESGSSENLDSSFIGAIDTLITSVLTDSLTNQKPVLVLDVGLAADIEVPALGKVGLGNAKLQLCVDLADLYGFVGGSGVETDDSKDGFVTIWLNASAELGPMVSILDLSGVSGSIPPLSIGLSMMTIPVSNPYFDDPVMSPEWGYFAGSQIGPFQMGYSNGDWSVDLKNMELSNVEDIFAGMKIGANISGMLPILRADIDSHLMFGIAQEAGWMLKFLRGEDSGEDLVQNIFSLINVFGRSPVRDINFFGIGDDGINEDDSAIISGMDFHSGIEACSYAELTHITTAIDTNGNMVAEAYEASPAVMRRNLNLPDSAGSLQFKYHFANPGDGDSLLVKINGSVIWSKLGSDYSGDGLQDSGPIDISEYAGQTIELEFYLDSVGEANCRIWLDDVSVVADSSIPIPIGDGIASSLLYTEADGTPVTVTLKKGTGTLWFSGDNTNWEYRGSKIYLTGQNIYLNEIILNDDTSLKSSLVLKTSKSKVVGDDGLVTLESITGTAPLGKIHALNADLTGDGIVFEDSYVAYVKHHDLVNGASIVMLGLGLDKGVAIVSNSVGENCNIICASPIKSLSLKWCDGNTVIEAPWIGKIKITGDKRNDIAGDFGASLKLTDENARRSLTSFKITGQIIGGTWELAAPVGTISAKNGMASDWNFTAAGEVKKLDGGKGELGGVITGGYFGTIRTSGPLSADIEAKDVDSHGVSIKTLAVSAVGDVSVESEGLIKSIKATDWDGGNITAGSIKTLSVKGDFTGNIEAATAKTISIKGDLDSSNIELSADPGGEKMNPNALKLTVKGWINDSSVLARGDIKSISAYGVDGGTFVAGMPTMDAEPVDNKIDLLNQGRLGSVKVSGKLTHNIDGVDYSVIETVIGGGLLGKVSLGTTVLEGENCLELGATNLADIVKKIKLRDPLDNKVKRLDQILGFGSAQPLIVEVV